MFDFRFSQLCYRLFCSQVEASDTLTSVAARFDTTPSELTKLNRLTTRLIFPGQVLYVPNKQGAGAAGNEGPGTSADDGEGPVVSTPAVAQQLEGNAELLDEKGESLIIMTALALTFEWIFTLFIFLFLVQLVPVFARLTNLTFDIQPFFQNVLGNSLSSLSLP
jgi:LysM repeat protein